MMPRALRDKRMSDQPTPSRFKPDMPAIPGVSASGGRHSPGSAIALRLIGGLLALLVVLVVGTRLVIRSRHSAPIAAQPPPQIEIPTPTVDPSSLAPTATDANPGIATVSEMAKPWSSKEFFFRNRLTGDSIPALLIRLPGAAPSQRSAYWALAMTAAYGNCRLEYVTDLDKLKTDYGFRAAKHPMVGNPCSRTLFDPTRIANLPGNVWVRGAIAQGSDLRPPLGIEVKVDSKDILAVRME
jgi:hypothetical protein